MTHYKASGWLSSSSARRVCRVLLAQMVTAAVAPTPAPKHSALYMICSTGMKPPLVVISANVRSSLPLRSHLEHICQINCKEKHKKNELGNLSNYLDKTHKMLQKTARTANFFNFFIRFILNCFIRLVWLIHIVQQGQILLKEGVHLFYFSNAFLFWLWILKSKLYM